MSTHNALERFNKAVQLEKSGQYADALTEYICIINENVSFREAYVNLGSLLYRMNRFNEALKCFEKSLILGKDYITYFNIGSIYYKLGEYKRAVIHFEKSCSLNSLFKLPRLVIGLCYSRLNNLKAAESNFREVLRTWPDNRVALTALTIILFNDDKFDEALNYIKILLAQDANNIKIHEIRFNILYKTGKISESADEIKTLRKISDGYKYFDDYIASTSLETLTDRYGSIEEKISFLSEKPIQDPASLISLSLCHLFKGDTDEAIQRLFEAKKLFHE